jgi:cell division protein FtsQ
MSRRRTRNTRMTPARQRKKQFFAEVNARGGRERWQKLGMCCGLFLRFALVTALIYGAYFGVTRGWSSLFWKNPDYSVRDVKIHSDGSAVTREQILSASGIKLGQNILSYRLPDVQKAVSELPQIQKVKVLRYLPNKLEIWVEERKPVAWITSKQGDDYLNSQTSYLVDMEGNWFRPKQVIHQYETLPVIHGVMTDNLQAGQVIRNAELLAALELIDKNKKGSKFQPKSLDVSKGYCVIVTDRNGTVITFGLDDLDGQFARLDAAREAERNLSQQIATVNLMLSRNVPITWVPPQPPEETDFPPKPVEVVKPTSKDLKPKTTKKPEPKKPEPKREPKKTAPDKELYKPFLRA